MTHERAGRAARLSILALLGISLVGLVRAIGQNSPTYDECGHIASGLHHWATGDFEGYRVNPPLPRLLQTLPLVLLGVDPPASGGEWASLKSGRSEWPMARSLITEHGRLFHGVAIAARLANIPLLIAGLWLVLRCVRLGEARDGGGVRGPLLIAAMLFLGDPTVLAWSSFAMPDLASYVVGPLMLLAAARAARSDTAADVALYGAAVGIALAVKSTWLLTLPLWWLAVVGHHVRRERSRGRLSVSGFGRLALRSLLWAGVAWLVLCATYAFERVGQPLRSFVFASEPLRQPWIESLRASTLGTLPVPLPYHFVKGIDVQRLDFAPAFDSYLAGETRAYGWPSWYVTVAAYKWPLLWLALLPPALASSVVRERGAMRLVWAMPLLLFVAVSYNHQFTNHFRYVGAAYPFFHIVVARSVGRLPAKGRLLVLAMATIGYAQTLSASGNLVAYANGLDAVIPAERVYGLARVDSTIDYGQNLKRLADWCEANAVRLDGCEFAHFDELVAAYGLPDSYPPPEPEGVPIGPDQRARLSTSRLRWYALDVRTLHRTWPAPGDQAYRFAQPYAAVGRGTLVYAFADVAPSDRPD